MRVVFLGLTPYEEDDLMNNGVEVEYLKRLSTHEGEVCEALESINCSDDDWQENYYDLIFADGFRFYECSGFHLEEVK